MSDNDKCPTCGIAREHDGPHYQQALKQAGKPMCPDPFHDPALKPQGLDAVSGAIDAPSPDKVRGILRDEVVTVGGEPHIPLEAANRRLREVERELQKCKRRRESWKALASKYKQRLDIAHTRCDAALSELARTKRQLNALREAVEEVLERWDDSEVSEAPEAIYRRLRTALASLDEKEVER